MRVLLLILTATLGAAAHATSFRGTVVDPAGEPIPGVTVFIKGTQDSVVTEADGGFEITAGAAPVTLIAFLGGFESVEVDATPGQRLEIILTPALSESVTVVAAADREAPMSTWERRPLDIVRTPGAQADVFRALQTLPGVAKTDEGAGLFVRGGDASELRVMLDGAVIHHPYRFESPAGGQFGAVEPFLLEGIAFSTGGFSARHGNAMSAILELRGLGRPGGPAFTSTLGLAGLSTRAAIDGGGGHGIRFSGNLRFPRLLFAVNGKPREFERYPEGWDFTGSIHHDSPNLGSFKLFLMEQRTAVGVQVERESFDGFLHSDTDNHVLAAAWKNYLFGWQWNSSFGMNLYRSSTRVGVLDLDNDDRRASWRLDGARAAGRWLVRVGVDGDYARQDIEGVTPIRGGDYAGVSGTRRLDVGFDDWHGGTYVETERNWGRTTLTIGVRGDRSQLASSWFDPRLNVVHALTRDSQLRVAWGIYHQAPSAHYYDRVIPSLPLTAMRAEHRIVGYERGRPESPFHLRIEAYHKVYEDLPLEQGGLFSSDGYGTAEGVDLYVQRLWGRNSLRASYSYAESRRRWTPHDQRQRFPLPVSGTWWTDFSVPHSVSIAISHQPTTRISFGAGLNVASGRPFTPIIGTRQSEGGLAPVYAAINSQRMPRYERLDLTASYRQPRRTSSLIYILGVSNILARRNTFEYAYSEDFATRRPVVSATPRTVYVALSFIR